MMLRKLQRAHPTLRGHFAPAYLAGSNMAYLFFIYAYLTFINIFGACWPSPSLCTVAREFVPKTVITFTAIGTPLEVQFYGNFYILVYIIDIRILNFYENFITILQRRDTYSKDGFEI